LLLRLDRVKHLGKAGSVVLAPTSFPTINLGRIEVEVEEDGRPLRQGAKKNVPAEKISLSDKFANGKGDADGLSDDLTCQVLMICQKPTV
jgi:hypothetical protein